MQSVISKQSPVDKAVYRNVTTVRGFSILFKVGVFCSVVLGCKKVPCYDTSSYIELVAAKNRKTACIKT